MIQTGSVRAKFVSSSFIMPVVSAQLSQYMLSLDPNCLSGCPPV